MALTLHAADLVCPISDPPVVAGGVLVDSGRIVAVGAADALAERAQRRVTHRGVLLPGLVDARTRIELADARRLAAATDDWDGERWSRSAHRGRHELLRAGVTVACDVVGRGPGVPALARAGVAGDSLVAVSGVRDAEADDVLAAVGRSLELPASGRRVGIAVDAERVGDHALAGAAALAARAGAPLHVDVGGTALARLERAGALAAGTRLAGLLHLDGDAAADLAARDVVFVLAPRATWALGSTSGPALADLAAAGAMVALTAGGAPEGEADEQEAPDPLAAAAAWRHRAEQEGLTTWPATDGPRPLAEAALRLVAADGAEVLGHPGHGALRAGGPADFCVVDVPVAPGTGSGRGPAGAAHPTGYERLLADGPGRQVLTVIGGVRRARRTSATEPWPALSDHRYEEA